MFKIFNTASRDNVNYELHYTGILPLAYQIDLRKLRFYHAKHIRTSVGGNDGIVWHALIATSKRMVDALMVEYGIFNYRCRVSRCNCELQYGPNLPWSCCYSQVFLSHAFILATCLCGGVS